MAVSINWGGPFCGCPCKTCITEVRLAGPVHAVNLANLLDAFQGFSPVGGQEFELLRRQQGVRISRPCFM